MSVNDFVFMDHAFRVYRVRKCDGDPWLCYWSKSKSWVTLRKLEASEAAEFFKEAMVESLAKLYEAGVPFLKCPP